MFVFLCVCLCVCVQVMFVMTPGIQRRRHNLLDQFLSHPLAHNHLARTLLRIYTSTVTHTHMRAMHRRTFFYARTPGSLTTGQSSSLGVTTVL